MCSDAITCPRLLVLVLVPWLNYPNETPEDAQLFAVSHDAARMSATRALRITVVQRRATRLALPPDAENCRLRRHHVFTADPSAVA
jgi:hypothetical protein